MPSFYIFGLNIVISPNLTFFEENLYYTIFFVLFSYQLMTASGLRWSRPTLTPKDRISLFYIMIIDQLYYYVLNITAIRCIHSKIYGIFEMLFYDELSFRHYLQHYPGTTRTTEIQYLWLHR